MVNVGLRAFLWEQKSYEQKVKRELWNLNGATYEGYRAYIRYVKDFGFPDRFETAVSASFSRLETTQSIQFQRSTLSLDSEGSLVSGLYTFSSISYLFDEAHCAVDIVRFGRLTADFLAFAAADGCIYIASTINDTPSGILQVLRGHTGRVQDLDWSQDNAFLLSCGRDGDLCLWLADSGALVRKFEEGGDLWGCPLACCRFHPVNQNLLFAGTVAGKVVVLNSSTGRAVSVVSLPAVSHGGVGVACLEVTPTHLIAADSKGGLHLFSCLLHDGQLQQPRLLASVAPPRNKPIEPACMEFLPHSTLARGPAVLLVEGGGQIQLFRLHERKGRCRLELKCETVVGDGSTHKIRGALCPAVHLEQPEVLAVGGEDCRVHLYDISRQRKEPLMLAQLQVHSAPVLDVSWSYDESILASCDTKGVVVVWKRDPPGPTPPTPAVP